MKPVLLIFAACLLVGGWAIATSAGPAAPAPAGSTSPAKGLWQTDFTAALEEARNLGRPIVLEFTGSDWCPPCMALAKEVLETKPFADRFSGAAVLVKLDFPRRSPQDPAVAQQNRALATRFNIESFPTFVILDQNGREVARQSGYQRGGGARFLDWLESSLAKAKS